MSFKLLLFGTSYPGYLKSFYQKYPNFREFPYNFHHKLLLENSTEFVSSYTRTFNKLGIDANCIIVNDNLLQEKWKTENDNKSLKNKKLLFEQVKLYQPEILFIEDIRFVDKDWINTVRREIKSVKLIIAYHCAPYYSSLLEILKNIDFLITCTPGLKIEFEKLGIKTYFVYHGFDVELLQKINEENNFPKKRLIFSGSLFPGNGYHAARIELIESILKENIDISLYVNIEKKCKIRAKQSIYLVNTLLKRLKLNKLISYFPLLEHGLKPIKNYSNSLYRAKQQPVYGLKMYEILAKSEITLNKHIEVAGNYAGNMRLFEATGIGTCLLTDKKSNLPDLFESESEIVVYENAEDCINKIKWLQENKEERKKIAATGQQKTLKSHTVENRCNQIIEIINNELKNLQ